MYLKLMALKTYAAMALIIPDSAADLLINSTVTECERVKRFMLQAFNNRKDANRSIEVLNAYRYTILQIANDLTQAPNLDNKVVSEMRAILIELVNHTEVHYGHLLDKSHELPLFLVQELSKNLQPGVQEIEERLHQKKIPKPFVKQLIKAHQDLFKPNKLPKLSYADSQYLSRVIPLLKSFVLDDREKDWNNRLMLLLIKYNFNHMGIYKLLKDEQDKAATQIKEEEKLNQYFFNQQLWLNEIQVIPTMAYNLQTDGLKELLLQHLQLLKQQTKENLEIAQQKKKEKIELSTNVDIMRLYFYYLWHTGMFNYPFKTDAADAICQHIRTKGTDQVSPRSLLKFDKIAMNNAAIKFNQQLQHIQTQLGKDFDL